MVEEGCFILFCCRGQISDTRLCCFSASRTIVKAYIMVGNLPGRQLFESQTSLGTGAEGSIALATKQRRPLAYASRKGGAMVY